MLLVPHLYLKNSKYNLKCLKSVNKVTFTINPIALQTGCSFT